MLFDSDLVAYYIAIRSHAVTLPNSITLSCAAANNLQGYLGFRVQSCQTPNHPSAACASADHTIPLHGHS